MHKSNKGFTLVEVVLVILIISILSFLIFPSIINYIENGKNKYNKELKEQLLIAGKNYFSSNSNLLPKKKYDEINMEKHSYVTLSELQSRGFTKQEFVDADDRSCINSYVLVSMPQGTEESKWHSCLICQGEEDESLVNYGGNYCTITDWDDNSAPVCSISSTKVYNPEEIKLRDITEETSNVSQIWLYNIKTGKEKVIDVSNKSMGQIQNLNIADYLFGDGEYNISIRDNGGNFGNCNENNKIIIDTVPPVITLINSSGGNWTNGRVDITLTAKEEFTEIKKLELSYDNKTWQATGFDAGGDAKNKVWTPYYDYEQNRTLYVRVTDIAGNVSEVKSTNIKIDQTAPVITLTNSSGGNWTNGRVDITVTATEEASSLKKIELSYDNKSWQTVSFDSGGDSKNKVWTPYYVDEQNRTMYVRVTDEVGNVSVVKSTNIKIDKTPPTVTISNSSNGEWTNGRVDITVTAKEELTEIKKIELSYDNKTWQTTSFDTGGDSKNKVWTPYYVDEQNRTLYVRVTDSAGNISAVKSTNIKIDKTPPTVTLSNSSGGEWTKSDVKVSATASDNVGIKNIQYSLDNKSWSNLSTSSTTGSKTWDNISSNEGTRTVYVRSTDTVGNISSSVSTSVKIDITPPYEYAKTPKGWGYTSTNKYCYIYHYHFKDTLSGVYKLKYGHCYEEWGCSGSSSAYNVMKGKSYEIRNWSDGGLRQIDYCIEGFTANIYFSVCDKAENCKEFGTYSVKIPYS